MGIKKWIKSSIPSSLKITFSRSEDVDTSTLKTELKLQQSRLQDYFFNLIKQYEVLFQELNNLLDKDVLLDDDEELLRKTQNRLKLVLYQLNAGLLGDLDLNRHFFEWQKAKGTNSEENENINLRTLIFDQERALRLALEGKFDFSKVVLKRDDSVGKKPDKNDLVWEVENKESKVYPAVVESVNASCIDTNVLLYSKEDLEREIKFLTRELQILLDSDNYNTEEVEEEVYNLKLLHGLLNKKKKESKTKKVELSRFRYILDF